MAVMLSTEFKHEFKHDVACCTRDGTARTLDEGDSKGEATCKNMSKFSFISLTKNNHQQYFIVN